MSILCATDFSPRGTQGVQTAALLANKLHDPIDLMHVIEPVDGELPNVFFDEVRRSSGERLLEEANRLRQHGATVRTRLPIGPVADSIDEFARQEKPRLVVVSAVGRTAPEDWLLGSTAERTAERVHTPTLVIRDSTPFEAWTQGRRPLKVLVACDFTLSTRGALRWVRQLTEIGPCEIIAARVVSLYNRNVSRAELPEAGGEPATTLQDSAVDELAEWVEPFLGDLKPELYCLSSLGRPDFRLVEFAEQNHVDLIVTGTRQKHGLQRLRSGSFSRGILRYAPMNVACIPLTESEGAVDGQLPNLERVLVATDFSDPANRATSFGCSLVGQGGKLELLSVIERGDGEDAEKIKRRLREQVPAVAAELNIDTITEVLAAEDVASAICSEAERFGAQVICVGTHGSNSLSITLLGSVAHSVAARSRRPVLLVPHFPE